MPNKRRNDESQAGFVATHFLEVDKEAHIFECQKCSGPDKRRFACEKGIRVSYAAALTHLIKNHSLTYV